jgi:DNA-binding transcriptional ArsR family regulator
MLEEPLATVEMARRLKVTSSAVNQHLRVLQASGLLTSTRDRRQVLYRRTRLGDQLVWAKSAREGTNGQSQGPGEMDAMRPRNTRRPPDAGVSGRAARLRHQMW